MGVLTLCVVINNTNVSVINRVDFIINTSIIYCYYLYLSSLVVIMRITT